MKNITKVSNDKLNTKNMKANKKLKKKKAAPEHSITVYMPSCLHLKTTSFWSEDDKASTSDVSKPNNFYATPAYDLIQNRHNCGEEDCSSEDDVTQVSRQVLPPSLYACIEEIHANHQI